MKYVPVQGLARGCSQIVMGSSLFGLRNKAAIFELLDTYIEQGGNTIDTARIYQRGESELVLAMWLKSRQNRGNMIVINKGGHHHIDSQGIHHPAQKRVTPNCITQDLLDSLESMGLDYLDIYLLHRDDPAVPVGELMDVLEEHKKAGRIKTYGVSNWSVQRIEEAIRYTSRKGYAGIAVNSPSLSLARINEPRWVGCVYAGHEDIRWHEESQKPLLAWASQASGFFAGIFSAETVSKGEIARVYHNEANRERLFRAHQLSKLKGTRITPTNIALAYVLNQQFPVCAIIGPHQTDNLLSSLRAMNIELTEEEMLWLDLKDDYRAIG
ncbi:MAG: aldo/keto reductase [Negativicutes bacterium]|nr:aldo/keto reductase [Negativicutes bacterium]